MSRCFLSLSLALLSLPIGLAVAQPSTFHGPVAGFVYSRASRTVRPLLGLPGAARIGSPLLNELDSASVAPGGRWALITKAGHSSFVRGLADLAPADYTTDLLLDNADRVLWNRDGSVALLYSTSANQLQRVRLSDTTAIPEAPLDLAPWGQAAVLALDPGGNRIAFGITGAGVYTFRAGESPVLVSSMEQPAAATFDNTGILYSVDAGQQRILQFDPASSSLEFASLVQQDGPALQAAGLAVSGDGRYLLLADRTTQAVRVYEIASRTLANTLALDFIPSRFEALSAGPTFLLNGDNGNEWLLVLDARQIPGVSFVPASQEEPYD